MSYIKYENPKTVASLDVNTYDMTKSVTFPRGLYGGQTTQVADYICTKPRNTDTHYIIDQEKLQHPDHFSRFGYARSPNGYGVGHWPGRYRTSSFRDASGNSCCDDPQPSGVAPARMYSPEHTRGSGSALCTWRYGKRDYHSPPQFLKA